MDEAEQISLPSEDTGINGASPPASSTTFGLGPQEALEYRKRLRGMIGVASKVPLKDRSVLSLVYTPGVAEPCREIAKNPLSAFDYTIRGLSLKHIIRSRRRLRCRTRWSPYH
jgi:hypothetical protein